MLLLYELIVFVFWRNAVRNVGQKSRVHGRSRPTTISQ